VEGVSGKERALEREQTEVPCFRKTVLASHLKHKKAILLVAYVVSGNGF
jgi:hypothetical protein